MQEKCHFPQAVGRQKNGMIISAWVHSLVCLRATVWRVTDRAGIAR